jgi:acetyl esterase
MPVNPETQAILDLTATWGGLPIETLTAVEARAQRAVHVPESLEMQGPPEEVHRVEERTIPTAEGGVRARIYRPDRAETLPVLVFYHGGGWVFGDLETMDRPCRHLANAVPCVVVSVEYRLAPEHPFPAPEEDAYGALTWAAEQAAGWNADRRRLAVAGDSAGGNLAAAVCLMARERQGPMPAFQLLIYPVTDSECARPSMTEFAVGFGLTAPGMDWFWRQYAADPAVARSPYASVMHALSLGGLPPALVITAECDVLRDQGEAYALALAEAGVAATITRYAGCIHGFFPQAGALESARRAQAQAVRALAAALAGQATAVLK